MLQARSAPTALNAANGVPLVNIETPSADAFAQTYRQFDVQPKARSSDNWRATVVGSSSAG